MKRFLIVFLAALLCGAFVFTSSRNTTTEPEPAQAETIHYQDISGDYLFVQNLSETEWMVRSLRNYLKDGSVQIRPSVPDDVVAYYAESTWDPAEAVSIPGGPICCVEAWDIYKNGEFQKTSYTYVSRSVGPAGANRQADDEQELQEILDACELDIFEPEVAKVFENAVERLFYSDSFRIGSAALPQSRVRSRLHLLDWMILDTARDKLQSNLDRPVKNSTAYTMATIFNCIAESESDLLVDPYLNSIGAPPGRR